MILLILAIVIALIIFFTLRSLFVPFIILMCILWVVNKVESPFKEFDAYQHSHSPHYQQEQRDAASQSESHVSAHQSDDIYTSPPPSTPQGMVCKQFQDAADNFTPLRDEWNEAEKEENGLKKKIEEGGIKKEIDSIKSKRDKYIYKVLSRPTPKIQDWDVIVDSIDYDDIVEKGAIKLRLIAPCSLPIEIDTASIHPDEKNKYAFAGMKKGMKIKISGYLMSRSDPDKVNPETIEWGGLYLWGPFGGLNGDATFFKPRFTIDMRQFTIP